MKRFWAFVGALVVLFGGSTSAIARNYVPTGVNLNTGTDVAFTIQDLRNGPGFVSILMKPKTGAPGETKHGEWCLSFTTEVCKLEIGHTVQAHAIIPSCAEADSNCVVGLSVQISGSAKVEGVQLTGFDTGFSFPSLPTLGTPAGSTPSLWRVPGVIHDGGTDLYVVAANMSFTVTDGLVVRYGGLSVSVYPVVELNGRYRPAAIETIQDNGQTLWVHDNGEQGSNDGCTLTTTGKCWARAEFAPGMEAEVSILASNQINGWLHGRLQAPEISITPKTSSQNLISVKARPVDVPIMYAESNTAGLSKETMDLFKNPFSFGGFHNGNSWYQFPAYEDRSRKLIAEFAKATNDRAAAVYTSWQFNTMNSRGNNVSCLSNQQGLIGLVTTNAMAYEQYPPAFVDGSLEYSVAGLHYLPSGELAVGVYDLLVRSDVARCLYGFSKAPVSAKVQVLTSDGEHIVASTQVSEKDGWLKLAAYGFTFSEKKIKATIFQSQAVALQKYKGKAVNLTSSQRFQVEAFSSKSKGATGVVCNSTYFSSKDRATAEARAKAACAYFKKLAPDLATRAVTTRVTKQSEASKVYLKSS